jgi:D-alanyl-D-alanine carboxypeptidase (penicillin-binding protein 5/6)
MRLTVASFLAPLALCLLLHTTPAQARSSRKAKPKVVAPAPDAVLAPAWVLMDPVSGRVLKAKNPHLRMFPASTTKTMTALLAIESGRLDEVVRIGPNPPKTGEQSILLLQGEQFVLRDLVRAAMIKSANDACVAIAEAIAGSEVAFAKMMTARAKELGAVNTQFRNPHGLHNPNHYSTAYDLALIAQAAMRYPEFNEMTRTQNTQIHGNWKIGPVRPLLNRNKLLFRWAQCDGVKTGYTRQAGRCLIASATQVDATTRTPWRLLSVVLKSPNTWHDSQALLAHHGFARFQTFLAARASDEFGEAPVQNGAPAKAILARDALLTLRTGEKSRLTHNIEWHQLAAPIQKGQAIGNLAYFADGQKIAVLPLVAQDEVPFSSLPLAALVGASQWNGLSVFSVVKVPPDVTNFAARWTMPALMLVSLMLLWSGLKQSNEKQQQPAQRRSQNSGPNPAEKKSGGQNPSPDRQASSAALIGNTARSTPRNSAANAARNCDAHSRTAREAEHLRHSAPGSIHARRKNVQRTEDYNAKQPHRQPCAGEQFVTQFLNEETESRALRADSEHARRFESR